MLQELESFCYDAADFEGLPFDFYGGYIGYIGYVSYLSIRNIDIIHWIMQLCV